MSTSPTDHVDGDHNSGFDSRDCVYLINDGPGDNTIRPLRPSLMRLALAERERMARWKAWLKQHQDQPPEQPQEP
jgi:hypothetical protein